MFERIESRSVLDSQLGQIISSFRSSSLSFFFFQSFFFSFLEISSTDFSFPPPFSFIEKQPPPSLLLVFNRSTLVERHSRRVSRNEERTRRLNYGKAGESGAKGKRLTDERERLRKGFALNSSPHSLAAFRYESSFQNVRMLMSNALR